MSNKKSTSFRPDIEGLRALAVLAVLAFHYRWSSITGGFVGVDIFFVISGFLISRNILTAAQSGEFSFKEFYIRRARRLFPALFLTVALTLFVGVLIAPPNDLKLIAISSIASIFSLSNFYFWGQSGYFDGDAVQKPLLHTWSLAVEEQFYLVWPLLVVVLSAFVKNPRIAVAVLIILGIASVWAAESHLLIDQARVFYLTPYRISEFVLGAVCAWIPHRSNQKRITGELFSIIALGLIAYPMFSYSDATLFPGLSALLPCLGAAMLIVYNGGGFTRWLLTNPVATGIGRISYSLYLVHWPMYVLYRQWKGKELVAQETLLLSFATFVLAVVMYRFVEQPFRIGGSFQAEAIPTRSFAKLFVSLTAVMVALSAGIWFGQGWSWRYPAELIGLEQESAAEQSKRFRPYLKHCKAKNTQPCDVPAKGINVFILGDSHAPDLFNALVEQFPEFHYVLLPLGGCPPLVQEDFRLLSANYANRAACMAKNRKLLYEKGLAKADLVIINALFLWYKPEHLIRTVLQIRKTSNVPIAVFGNYLVFDDDLPDLVVRHGKTKMDDYYAKRLSANTFAHENELESLAKTFGFTYISKKQLFCGNDSVMSCPLMIDGKLFTYDRHHLSLAAANRLGRELQITRHEGSLQIEMHKTVAQAQ